MQALGRRAADVVAEHLATLREQPVITTDIPAGTRRRLAAAAPEAGTDFDALLAILQDDVLAYAAREPHPGFLGYVPGCPTFPAVLEWFRTWVGMPPGTGGLLTHGGSGATLTTVVAARHAAWIAGVPRQTSARPNGCGCMRTRHTAALRS